MMGGKTNSDFTRKSIFIRKNSWPILLKYSAVNFSTTAALSDLVHIGSED